VEEPTIPEPEAAEVRVRVLAAGTGFTDTMIRRGRYPHFNGPLPAELDAHSSARDCVTARSAFRPGSESTAPPAAR
jgi:NADPH:quinone reductase-like Zn-dependent oxidoreductase